MKEFSVRAVLLGVVLGAVFAIGNAYLGLKVGLTVSASIPAAVISMAVLRAFSRNVTILENNIVQTIASAGESLAAGVIFTIPALVYLGEPLELGRIFLVALLGGLLGVLLMVPLRHTLMVEEHGTLPYPEGTACAEILRAREGTGERAMLAVWGLILGAIDKILIGVFRLWNEVARWTVGGTQVAIDTTPAMLGVGYIIGIRYSLILFAGGAVAWWVLTPLIQLVGGDPDIRSIGIGAVAAAGVISLVRLFPVLVRSLSGHFKGLLTDVFHKHGKERTEQDLPLLWVILGVLVVLAILYVIPQLGLNWLAIVLILVLGFFFVALTSVTVGIVGNSSNPVSGMVICTLLVTTLIFVALGWTERVYLILAMTVGSVVAVAVAMAGDTSQDLKTGFLVGATPRMQQVAALIGTLVPAFVVGWILIVLNDSYGLGSKALPAPQAMMMATVVEGVIGGTLPYKLVSVGVVLGVAVELMGIRSLPFALGLYLPLGTSVAIGAGGVLSWLVGTARGDKERHGRGVLLGSGLIAGDALTGIVIAGLAIVGLLDLDKAARFGPWISLAAYLILAATFGGLVLKRKR